MVSGQRPFVGRSLPELTQAIASGSLQPPSIFTPELSPELEQIILVAMARDRNERYEQAMLMAQALRALNLQAPTHLSPGTPDAASGPAFNTMGSKFSRERVVMQPPKRPQMQRPRYLDLETKQPSPGELIAPKPAPAARPPVVSAEPPLVSGQEIDTEGPTGPLEPPMERREIEQFEQRSRELSKRQPFWRKLFRSPPA